MSLTLMISFVALFLLAFFGRYIVPLPKNIWLLFVAQPLSLASSSMVVFAGGLLATKIAPSPDLATLPLTLMILGTATAVIPASLAMKKFGRRKGTMIGLFIAFGGALMSMVAAMQGLFFLLVGGSRLLGASLAFVAQMRFAAIESVEKLSEAPKAISVLMVGGIFAAILGPEVAVTARTLIESPYGFAGSYLGLAILLTIAIGIIALLDPIGVKEENSANGARSIRQIVCQPIFIIAVVAGAIGYSVMSYVMTATPLSMHAVEGHSLETTKWVVQSHIVAMYLPSLFSAYLVRYFGIAKLMIFGCLMYSVVVIVALSGHEVMHYWWTMVLLLAGTFCLPAAPCCYRNLISRTNDLRRRRSTIFPSFLCRR
jgi:MFS family permease